MLSSWTRTDKSGHGTRATLGKPRPHALSSNLICASSKPKPSTTGSSSWMRTGRPGTCQMALPPSQLWICQKTRKPAGSPPTTARPSSRTQTVMSGPGNPTIPLCARRRGISSTCRPPQPAAGSPLSAGRATCSPGAWTGRAGPASPPDSAPHRCPPWNQPAWTASRSSSAKPATPGKRRSPPASPDQPLSSSPVGRTASPSPKT